MHFIEQFLGKQREPSAEEIFRENREGLVDHLRTGAAECNERLRALFGTTYQIDEMALLVGNHHDAMILVSILVELDGFELFNCAKDEVETTPIPSQYDVRYWFVRTPWDFRLEIMVLESGYSPVHSLLVQHLAKLPPAVCAVHASFKVSDEEKYAAIVHSMQQNGYELQQHCKSTYGRFSYFGYPTDPDKEYMDQLAERWTIKPRINSRDAK